jgi:serine phosphatase RsbU (regulator of sigma subunit)
MTPNVVHRFTIRSIFATVLVAVGLTGVVSKIVTRDLLEDEGQITADALRIVTSTDLPPARFTETVESGDPKRFEYIWQHVDRLPDVFRMKVYDRHGTIVWSDEEELIGKLYEENEELEEALAGSVVVEMGEVKEEHEYEAEEFPESELMEIYVPLLTPGDRSVYGVVEIYKHPQEYFAHKRRMVRRIWMAGLGGGLILFFVLHGLFQGALRENLRLQSIERQLAAVELEMKAAGELQSETMPSELPDVPGFRLGAHHETSREVGGDYYDAFAVPDGSFALVVADSEGKGMPGALVTAEVHEHFHVQATRLPGSADVVSEVNRQLAGESSPERMVTAFFARLRPEAGELVCCSAGHCPALLLRDGTVRKLNAGGVPVGLTHAAEYEEETVELEPGDVLLVYTDGVTEAADAAGEQFGAERLEAVLRGAGIPADPDAVVATVRKAVDDFTGGADPADDTTILCLVAESDQTGP